MRNLPIYILPFLLLSLSLSGQVKAQGLIEGTVVDASGQPLPGVNVILAGEQRGAATDPEGAYTISDVAPGTYTLEVRFIGFRSQTREVDVIEEDITVADFTLRQDALNLEELVVTGAGGPVERRKLGNTVGTISGESIVTAPISSFSDVLQGREPGLVGLPSSGATGEGARIRIRGSASLSQSNEPLIFVDGVRVDGGGGFGGYVGAGGAASPSRLDDINPRSIERVEVLKGAAAATLFGTQASNGVIQVFTKRGVDGPPQFEFFSKQGFSSYPRSIPDNVGFARTQAQADTMSYYFNQGVSPYELVSQNYLHELFGTGHEQEYGASIRGGAEGINYYIDGRWTHENGPIDGAGVPFQPGHSAQVDDILSRLQGTAQVNLFPLDRVQVRLSTGFSNSNFETFQTGNNVNGIISGAMHGKPELVGYNNLSGSSYTSTLQERLQQSVLQKVNSTNASLGVNYRPVERLIVDATVGLDYTGQASESIRPYAWNINNYAGTDVDGARRTSDRSYLSTTADIKATLTHELSSRLHSSTMIGVQSYSTRDALRSGLARDFPGPGLGVSGAASDQQLTESLIEERELGAFAQQQLDIDDFLFVTVGGRYDAHSAFGTEFSGIFYPKISASAALSDASFWQDIGPISSLRIRSALGQSGLQPGAFDALTTYAAQNSTEGAGIVPANLGNPELRPEISTEWELGFELGLFGDRWTLETTYWDRSVKDALVARQFPVSGGFLQRQRDNIGELAARGVELSTSGQILNTNPVSVDVFANTAYLWEQVVSMGDTEPIKVGGSYPRYRQFLKEGYAPGAQFGAKLERVPEGYLPVSERGLLQELGRGTEGVPEQSPASRELVLDYLRTLNPENASLEALNNYVLLADETGDGDVLNNYYGKPTPDWQGSFGVNVGFLGNFRLSTLFEYQFGNFYINDLTSGFRQRSAGIGRNTPASALVERDFLTGGVDGSFQPENDAETRLVAFEEWLNEHLALAPFAGLNAIGPGDFVRLREVSFTYSVPPATIQSFGARSLSLTLSGRNLWLSSRYPGIDPEVNVIGRGGGGDTLSENFLTGTDAWNLPLPKEVSFMLRLGF